MILPCFLFTYTKPNGKYRVQYWQTETPSIQTIGKLLTAERKRCEEFGQTWKQEHKVGRWKRCQKSKSSQTSKQKKMTTHIKCWSRSFCSVPEISNDRKGSLLIKGKSAIRIKKEGTKKLRKAEFQVHMRILEINTGQSAQARSGEDSKRSHKEGV